MPPILTLVNKLSDISFCDKQCSNVNDNEFKSKLINYIQDKLGVNIIEKQYVNLSPRLVRNVCHNQHIMSVLTNGNPYLLYLTKIDGVNCCFYIDRKLKDGYNYPKIHCVKYRFNDNLFNDTIFTGELVRDIQRRWYFILSDVLVINGELIKNVKNVLSRYEYMNNVLINEYIQDSHIEPCPLQIKKLFMYKNVGNLIDTFIPNLPYYTKGIIFYSLTNKYSNYVFIIPRENSIKIKKQEEILKILQEQNPELFEEKTNNITQTITEDLNNVTENQEITDNIKENNVVFKMLKTDTSDIYNLYCSSDNDLIKYDIALVPNIKISKMLASLFKNEQNQLGIYMECEYSKIFEKWVPIKTTKHSLFNKNNISKLVKKLNNSNSKL